MAHKIGTIREWKTQNFHVVVDAIEDYDLDLSWDEDGSTRRGLENGELVAFTARARMFFRGLEFASDYLGGCIYKSIEAFEDHRECGIENRKRLKREGRFQIYRKARPYDCCLSTSDKLRKRGFATRELAEVWAQANATEAYEIFETGKCGSYFADMVANVCEEARQRIRGIQETVKVREVKP
jgi:hypothetical protein